jgi:nucleoside-diphosphate-sugar epimerase
VKVLITGASGRVGANLVKALVGGGHQVRAFVYPGDVSRMHKLDGYDVEIIYGDLTDYAKVAAVVQGVDVVYHIGAAMIGPFDNTAYFDINAKGTFNVVEAIRQETPGLRRLIYASTDAIYPVFPDDHPAHVTEEIPVNPTGMYAFTKWVGERLVFAYHRQYGIPAVAFRFAWVMGAGEIADPDYAKTFWLGRTLQGFKAQAERSPEAKQSAAILEDLWPGEERLLLSRSKSGTAQKMHFVDVRDLVQGLLLGMEKDEAVGELFTLPGPRVLSGDELVPYLSERLGVPYVEADLPISRTYRELSWAKANRLLGYTPKHDLESMVELALAMQRGEDTGLIETGVPYGVAGKS